MFHSMFSWAEIFTFGMAGSKVFIVVGCPKPFFDVFGFKGHGNIPFCLGVKKFAVLVEVDGIVLDFAPLVRARMFFPAQFFDEFLAMLPLHEDTASVGINQTTSHVGSREIKLC
jgi:hypothetical protein